MDALLAQAPVVLLYTILFLELCLAIGLLVFMYIMISPLIKGAPNFPSQKDRIPTMLEFAKLKKKDVIVDLGSGNGTLLFAIAQKGYPITGLEIDPFAVRRSKKEAEKKRLSNLITVHRANFWRKNLSQYNVVFVYGINYIMKDLEKKLKKELRPGSRVISNRYEFPSWKPTAKKNNVLLYIV